MKSRFFRNVVIGATAVMLSSCAMQEGGSMLNFKFWESGPFSQGDAAELGIAEMVKGNYLGAEAQFNSALRTNPRDTHALLGAAILYHNTGQLVKARELYEAVLAIRPPESQQFINLTDISTRPLSQVASVNLSLLESGGLAGDFADAAAGIGNQPVAATMYGMPTTTTGYGSAASNQNLMAAAPAAAFPSTTGQVTNLQPASRIASADFLGFSGDDLNVISRFTTLRALRDQGLVTPDEFHERRSMNIGALIPLSSNPPSAGLARRVPTTEQVVARIQAIGRALELRAISIGQHAAERTMILDALLPSAPVVIANPVASPKELMQAADMVRRLEKLRDSGYISAEEYARERAAIEAGMMPEQPPALSSLLPDESPLALGQQQGTVSSMMAGSGPAAAAHLASYRSAKQAEQGWAQLKRAHPAILGGLNFAVVEVDLGTKGMFFRLLAGPFSNNQDSLSACKKLKSRRQFCDPATADFG